MARWRDVKKRKKQTVIVTSEIITPAPLLDRMKAFLTDTFMISMPIIYIVIYLVMGSREEFRDNMATGWLYILIPHFLIVTLLWSFKGQTPGMKAYEIKVVRWREPKKLPNFLQATIRYFTLPISILSVVGIIVALFRKDKQTLHDLLSLTKTIKDVS